MIPLRDNLKVRARSHVVWGLILVNLAVFIVQLSVGAPKAFIEKWALVPARINFFNLDTLTPFLTAIFLHGGFIHLLGNMWFLGVFGRSVEARFGHLKFLFYYLFWGVLAFLVQYLFAPESSIPMIGASGAVAGVLGAYLVLFSRARVLTLIPVFFFITTAWIPAFIFLPYWFLIQFFSGASQIGQEVGSQAGVAFWAHVGGFIVGYITAKSYQKDIEPNYSKRRL